MTSRDFDDETLMAFADGELDAASAARIEAAMETDDTLVERVAIFIESRARTAAALKPLIDEPVPDALLQSVREMVDNDRKREAPSHQTGEAERNVVPLRPRRANAPSRRVMAIAASLAIVVAGANGYYLMRKSAAPGGIQIADVSDPAIANALDSAPSGKTVGTPNGTIKLVASFRDEAGMLCREFELANGSNFVSIACRSDAAWNVRLAVAAPATGTDYVPAGAAETIDAYLASINAGPPLSEAEEAEALNSLGR